MDNQLFTYFVSDLHLGLHPRSESLQREKRFVNWLDSIKDSTAELFLVGDVFDFWWEYKRVVPKGYVRLLGKIAEFTDEGIPVHFFTGNHDMWTANYLSDEVGMRVHTSPLCRNINGHVFFIAHGDDLGPGDWGYKILNQVFKSRSLRWLYSLMHPNIGVAIGENWAKHSRYSKSLSEAFKGEDQERLVQFAKQKLKDEHIDYFVLGHRHCPVKLQLSENTVFINLGDWITHFSYGVFDGTHFTLKDYK